MLEGGELERFKVDALALTCGNREGDADFGRGRGDGPLLLGDSLVAVAGFGGQYARG